MAGCIKNKSYSRLHPLGWKEFFRGINKISILRQSFGFCIQTDKFLHRPLCILSFPCFEANCPPTLAALLDRKQRNKSTRFINKIIIIFAITTLIRPMGPWDSIKLTCQTMFKSRPDNNLTSFR